jgi:hypothetical protein
MSLQTSGIREELVHHFNAALGYSGACTQHQREDAHYESGRKDGLSLALELVDTVLRSGEGQPARRRPVEEIVAAVESIAEGAGAAPVTDRDHVRNTVLGGAGDDTA